MNNYLYYYINQLINISPNKTDDNVVFIKNYNTFDVDMFFSHLNISKSSLCLTHSFEADCMHTAFEPFMEWIRELCNKDTTLYTDTFFEDCNVYSLHRELFSSYIATGICKRTEDVIIPEIKYDSERLLKDFINIFTHISKRQHIIILLNSIHYADSSTFRLLNEFISSSRCNNIFFILVYNDFYKLPNYAASEFNKLLESSHSNFFHDSGSAQYDLFSTSTFSSFNPKSTEYDDYVIKLNNMIMTLCTDQALFYLTTIHNKFEIEQMHITLEQRIKMMLIHALANVYSSNNLAALLLCDKTKALLKENPHDKFLFELYYIIALAYEYNDHHDFAHEAYVKCKKYADLLDDEFYKFKAQLLFYIISFLGWKNIYMHQYLGKVDDKFLNLSKKYQYFNHLAYIVSFGYKECDSDTGILTNMYPHLDEGIAYAQLIGNDNFILIANEEKIYTSSCIGHFDGLETYQNRCIDILNNMNNPRELAIMYNSLGYNCSVHEDFSTANNYYNQAIKIILDNNFSEDMYEALYNKGILAVQTMNYSIACDYLKTSLQYIDELKIEKLRMANKSKIYGLLALCYYYMDMEYNCYLYLAKLERYIAHIIDATKERSFFLWDDDMFLYHFLKACLAKHEGAYEISTKYYDKALYHMNRSTENRYFAFPIYSTERAELYSLIGQPEKGQQLLKECIDFCTVNHYSFKYMVVNSVYTKLTLFKPSYDLSLGNIDMEQIVTLAKQSGIAKALTNRNNDINFLSTWKELMMSTSVPNILIDNAMSAIRSNFTLDAAIFYRINDDIYDILYNNSGINLDNKSIDIINKTLINLTSGFVTSRTDDEFANFTEILSIFGVNNIASILFCPIVNNENLSHVFIGYITLHNNFIDNTTKLYETNLEIVSFAIRQLVDSLNILENQICLQNINKKLEKNAVTDILTGLYNRHGMYKIFTEKIKTYTRFNLLYIDLDNFKAYNDTFGHDIGDQILVEFSELLQRCVDKHSYLIRYGGDEFIIINHSHSQSDAINIADLIFQELEDCNHFDYVIKDICKKDGIKFSKNNLLSCSIGIASGETKDDLDDVVIKADHELFKVKKNNKNGYSILENRIIS